MTTLSRLSISGVRSYDSNSAEVIEFEKPLTIIVGANGSGKTTIIEALKYACTGIQPPLSDGGKSFIHDIKLENTALIKAQIKLNFNTINNKSVLAIRSFQLSQKKDKREFKATEGVLKTTDKSDPTKITSISQKCVEIDNLVPRMMGVSRAVLENVIFCHQEDSFWPLSDSKTLKMKFDDLFAATRYTKALDVIKKLRKEKQTVLRGLEADLKVLDATRQQATKYDEKYLLLKKEQSDKSSELNVLQDKKQLYKSKLDIFALKRSQIDTIKQDINKLTTQIELEQVEVTRAYDRMSNEYDGSVEMLQNELHSKQNQRHSDDTKLKQYEQQTQQYDTDINEKQIQYNNYNKQYGRLEGLETDYKQNKQQCIQLIQKLMLEYNIQYTVNSSSDDYITNFVPKIKAKQTELQYDMTAYKQKYITELNTTYEQRINTLTLSEQQKSIEKQHKIQSNDKSAERLKWLNTELKSIDHKLHNMYTMKQQMDDIENQLNEIALNDNTEQLKKSIEQSQQQLKSNQHTLTLLQQKQKLNSSYTNIVLQYKTKSQSVQKDIHSYNTILQPINEFIRKQLITTDITCLEFSDHIEQLISVFNNKSLLEKNYNPMKLSHIIQQYAEKHTALIKTKESTINDLTLKLSIINDKLNTDTNELQHKQTELKSIESLFHDNNNHKLLQYTTVEFEEYIAKQTKTLDNVRGQKSLTKASRGLYDIMIKTGEKDHKCPMCTRDMDEDELDVFLQVNKSKMQQLDDNKAIERVNKQLQEQQQLCEKLDMLYKTHTQYYTYKDTEIPQLNKSITKHNNDKSDLDKKLSTEHMLLQQLQDTEKLIDTNVQNTDKLVYLYSEINDRVTECSELKHQIDEYVRNNSNVDTIENEIHSIETSNTDLLQRIESSNNKINTYINTKQDLITHLNNLKEQSIQLTELNLNQKSYTHERDELTTVINEHRLQINKLDTELHDIQTQLQQLKQQYDTDKSKHNTKYNELEQRYTVITRHVDTLNTLQQSINTFLQNKYQFTELQQKLQNIESDITLIRERQHDVQEEYTAYKNNAATIQTEITDIQANIEYRQRSSKIEQLKQSLQQKQQELNIILSEHDNTIMDLNEIQHNYDTVNNKYFTLKGSMDEIQRSMEQIKRDLQSAQYRDIHKKYHNLLIDVQILKLSIADLDVYSKSLDNALMYFHSIKMQEINELLSDYWKQIYRGKDIDSIEIQSNPMIQEQKRSYNYRVIMTQNDTKLDMRGRCSAGQKVLASLLIRLALADTFCLQCGILALDEPTTNLDHKNISSFAKALNDVIEKRKAQSNFQLIIITHDESFVEEIGQRSHCESYYRVYKDNHNYSRIRRQQITDASER